MLIRETASLVADVLPRLREFRLLTVSALETLPINAYDFPRDSMFHPIFAAVKDALKTKPLLPTDDGTFASAVEGVLPGTGWLREILSDAQLQQLFASQPPLRWLSRSITKDRTRVLWDYLTDELDLER